MEEKSRYSKIKTYILAFLSTDQIKINRKILRYLLLYSFSKERILFALNLVKLNYQIKRYQDNEYNNIVLLEEGLIHFTRNISHIELVKNKVLLEEIICCMFSRIESVLCVDCDLELPEVIARIKQRGNMECRFDLLDEEDLYKCLEVNQKCIKIMRNANHNKYVVKVNMINPVHDNAKLVFNSYQKWVNTI